MESLVSRLTLTLVLMLASDLSAAYAQPGAVHDPHGNVSLDLLGDYRETRFAADGRVARAWGLSIPTEGGLASIANDADAVERARRFVARYRHSLALDPRARLDVARVLHAHGHRVVRFSRSAHGGVVLGASLVVRLADSTGRVDYVGANLMAAPLEGVRQTTPDTALAVARLTTGYFEGVPVAAALVIDDRTVPVFVVDLAGPHLSQRTRTIVDARDGSLYASRPFQVDALGRVFAEDPISDANMTSDVELTHLTSVDRMTGRYFRVMSCNVGASGCNPMQLATADAMGDFLYDPMEPALDDAFVEVHAYHHANRIAEYFRDSHDLTWTCDDGTLMRVFVNYREEAGFAYDNAAYSPSGRECGFMLFGQGATQDFAYDADVVYHEFSHGVVDITAGLGFFLVDSEGVSYEPSALNEGTADYFAATLSGDPLMAEYFMGGGGLLSGEGALRRLDNDLVCPRDLFGQGHLDGRLWAALGWDIRGAIGPMKADALVFATLNAFDTLPTLQSATETLLATADMLVTDGTLSAADRTMVMDLAIARGLTDCPRIAPLDDEGVRTGWSGNGDLTAGAGGSIAPIQYRIDIPADATRLNVEIHRLTPAGSFTLYTRVGSPVRYVRSRRPPVIAEGEYVPDMGGRIVITRETDPDLTRCETLYIAVITDELRTIGQAIYEISATLETSGLTEACEEPPPDAGTPDSGPVGVDAGGLTPSGGGCTCRAARPTRGVHYAGGALVMLLLVWARRTTSWRT